MYKIPELLAPVGGLAQLLAAVENGADAVYLGGSAFNARMSADNFDARTMAEAIHYAHTRNVKVYVTVNTLLNDAEVPQALQTIAECWEAGADAFILQDWGFAALLKQYFAQIPLHLSTQGTVFNTASAIFARELGFERVVLAREVPLEAIARIARDSGVEIEVFVHGALCICYSGQCQLSRHLGSRSGNRGTCAQPCRLPYQLFAEASATSPEEKQPLAQGYLLSPKDLCGIDHLAALAEAGVASLKIEGRLKSPEYVAVVTRIYRKYLDQYAATGRYTVSAEDRERLMQIFNRGGFTEGYLAGNPRNGLMSPEIPKHQGLEIGRITGVDARRRHVRVQLTGTLIMGDGVEAHRRPVSAEHFAAAGGKRPGNVVTLMRDRQGKGLTEAQAGQEITIGYLEGNISKGDVLRRITAKKLLHEARASYENKSWQAAKQGRKELIQCEFTAQRDKPARLLARASTGQTVQCQSEMVCEAAVNRPLSEETVARQLLKSGGTPFEIELVAVHIEEGISLPLSALNHLRREALESITAALTWREDRQLAPEQVAAAARSIPVNPSGAVKTSGSSRSAAGEEGVTPPVQLSAYLFVTALDQELVTLAGQWRWRSETGQSLSLHRLYLPYHCFLDPAQQKLLTKLSRQGLQTAPYLPQITEGWHDQRIEKNFAQLAEVACEHGITVGSVGWIKPFVAAGAAVQGDYGLNIFNSLDAKLFREKGLDSCVLGHEAFDAGFSGAAGELPLARAVKAAGLAPEVVLGGTLPLMHSAHCAVGDLRQNQGSAKEKCGKCMNQRFFFRDRKGLKFPILCDSHDCSTVMFGDKGQNHDKNISLFVENGIVRFRIYGNGKSLFCDHSQP